jgi:hypothetical protein
MAVGLMVPTLVMSEGLVVPPPAPPHPVMISRINTPRVETESRTTNLKEECDTICLLYFVFDVKCVNHETPRMDTVFLYELGLPPIVATRGGIFQLHCPTLCSAVGEFDAS